MRYNTHKLKSTIPLFVGKPADIRHLERTSSGEPMLTRINELLQELKTLNFLEHSLRIIEICKEIQRLKES